MIEQITEKKGWTLDYVLEKVAWSNLIMMSSDRIVMKKRSETVTVVKKEDLKAHRERYNGKS